MSFKQLSALKIKKYQLKSNNLTKLHMDDRTEAYGNYEELIQLSII